MGAERKKGLSRFEPASHTPTRPHGRVGCECVREREKGGLFICYIWPAAAAAVCLHRNLIRREFKQPGNTIGVRRARTMVVMMRIKWHELEMNMTLKPAHVQHADPLLHAYLPWSPCPCAECLRCRRGECKRPRTIVAHDNRHSKCVTLQAIRHCRHNTIQNNNTCQLQ